MKKVSHPLTLTCVVSFWHQLVVGADVQHVHQHLRHCVRTQQHVSVWPVTTTWERHKHTKTSTELHLIFNTHWYEHFLHNVFHRSKSQKRFSSPSWESFRADSTKTELFSDHLMKLLNFYRIDGTLKSTQHKYLPPTLKLWMWDYSQWKVPILKDHKRRRSNIVKSLDFVIHIQ